MGTAPSSLCSREPHFPGDGPTAPVGGMAGRPGLSTALAPSRAGTLTVLPTQRGQPGSATEASVGGKVTAHFSSDAPARGSHLSTRCSEQMARAGAPAPGEPAASSARSAHARPGLRSRRLGRAGAPSSASEGGFQTPLHAFRRPRASVRAGLSAPPGRPGSAGASASAPEGPRKCDSFAN